MYKIKHTLRCHMPLLDNNNGQRKWGLLHNSDIDRIKTNIHTDQSTFMFLNWVTLIWIHNKVTQFKNSLILVPWLVITVSRLVDWIYWRLLPQSLFSRTLLSWLQTTRSILILVLRLNWFCSVPLNLVSRRTPWKTPSLNNSKGRLPLRCLEMDVLLFHGTLLLESVYRTVAQQRVYMSQ
jgi:hypothetical protein